MDAQGMQVSQDSNGPMKNAEEAALEAELK